MPTNNTIITGKEIIVGILVGLLALAVNLHLSFPLFGNVLLAWGNTFVLLALLTQRFPTALLACLVNSVGLAAFAELPYAGLLAMIEFCVLALLQYHRVYLLLSSIFFWLCIGMPLTWFAIEAFRLPFASFAIIFTIKEALMGLLCAAIACLIYFTLPAKLIATRQLKKEHKLATNIFSLSAMTLILPALVIALLLTQYSTSTGQKRLVENTQARANAVNNIVATFIENTRDKLINMREAASLLPSQRISQSTEFQQFMRTSAHQDPLVQAFVFVSQDSLNLTTTSNTELISNQSTDEATKPLYISYQEQSNSILISIPTRLGHAEPLYLQAQISIDNFATFVKSLNDTFHQSLLAVTNGRAEVLYADDKLDLQTSQIFSPILSPSLISNEIQVAQISDKHYHTYAVNNIYGWHVYVFNTPETLKQLYSAQIMRLGISLLVTIFLFLMIAHRLSTKMALPLVNLIEQSSDSPISKFEPLVGTNIESSSEIKAVATRLRKSHVLLKDFEHQLQLQVTEKTEELEQLNLILAAQAREDGLTQLLNRSGFDELANNAIKTNQRMNQPISLALVDIDKFKNINDTYGHPIGDECLKAFAGLMQSHCKRETDIIGRYGGEEFVILMSGKEVISHHQLIQNIHVDTQLLEVKVKNLPNPITFTVSVGVCSLLGDSMMDLAQIIQLADEELYKCKNNGRNQMSIVTIEASE